MKIHRTIKLLWLLPLSLGFLTACNSGGVGGLNGSAGSNGDASVGDVTVPGDGSSTGRPLADDFALRARVRNESSTSVDVTMRFIRDDSVVHLAFVRVPTATITTVSSPDMADSVELSGIDDRGLALERAAFRYGQDFDEQRPAEYLVRDRDNPNPPSDDALDDDTTLALTLREPSADATVALGSVVEARWTDGGGGPAALVRLFLRPVGAQSLSDRVPVAPGIGASLDGLNDQLSVVVQGVEPGRYELVAELAHGNRIISSVAPGVLRVVADPANVAPIIFIRSPRQVLEVEGNATINVQWTDSDPDDNATITFALERPDAAVASAASFAISPPIAENPDGQRGDTAVLSLGGVLPGVYDLVATATDGRLVGTDRVERAIRVLPSDENDAPQLVIRRPSTDVSISPGGMVVVGWNDSDLNDNARISLLLDAAWNRVGLGGGEQVLVAEIAEDGDGTLDEITVTLPSSLAQGTYRLVGVITDGMTQVVTRAPGFVLVTAVPPVVVVSDGQGNTPPDDEGAGDDVGDDAGGDDPDPDDPPDPGSTGGGDHGGGAGGGDDPNGGGGTGGDDGGNGGGGTDPDDNPLPPGVVVVDQPITPAVLRPVEPDSFVVPWQARTPLPPSRLVATNVPYGGRVTIELPVSAWRPASGRTVPQIEVPVGMIPNDAWPRSFDLIAELQDGLELQTVVSPAPVWIPQLVEVLGAGMMNYSCASKTPLYFSFSGLGIEWYGGGIREDDAGTTVEFWLSGDREVPASGIEDARHRLVWRSTGSPNETLVSRVTTTAVLNGGASVIASDEAAPTTRLQSGEYQLIVVADFGTTGRVVSLAKTDPIFICADEDEDD